MYCPSCGKEVRPGAAFCDGCGIRVAADAPPGGTGVFAAGPAPFPDEADVVCFVGEKSGFYLVQFRKFRLGRMETFVPTWNWSAFAFTTGWFLYRKMYLWALIAFVASFIPVVGLAAWIAAGVAGNYLYYRHVSARVAEARRVTPDPDLPAVLARMGGVHRWVVWVGVAIGILAVLGIVAAILVPVFVKGFCAGGRAI